MKLELILTEQELEDLINALSDACRIRENLIDLTKDQEHHKYNREKLKSYRMLANKIKLAKDIQN